MEALKNIDPVHAIAAKHKVHPTQVNLWKKEVAERLPEIFTKSVDAVAARRQAQWLAWGHAAFDGPKRVLESGR